MEREPALDTLEEEQGFENMDTDTDMESYPWRVDEDSEGERRRSCFPWILTQVYKQV